jgi:hypothetical protein
MRGVAAIFVVSLATILPLGCVRNFAEPPAERSDAVVLSARSGAYVQSVDDARVASAKETNSENGNRVRIVPGTHKLHVVTVGLHPGAWTFKLNTRAGEAYAIEPMPGNSVGLSVVEQSTGRRVPVN